MGINLKTLRPEPTVEGYSTPGGYSCAAVKPIALAKVRPFPVSAEKDWPEQGGASAPGACLTQSSCVGQSSVPN